MRIKWSNRIGRRALLAQVAMAAHISLGASVFSAQVSNATLGSANRTLAVDGRTQSENAALSALVPPLLASASVLLSPSPPSSNAGQTSNAGGGADQSAADDKKKQLKVNPLTGLAEAPESGYRSLTGAERVKLYFTMNYWSAGAYFGPFLSALLLDQATGSPAQWGGGFSGYGRRVASRLGNAILQGTFQAPVAAILHEDVRYITSSRHGFKHRAAHAIAYSFLTYNDQGRPTLNVANLSAYYASTAVSTAWLPGHHNLAGYTFGNASEQIALTMPVNLLQEFWPEVRRYAFHRH